MIKVTHFYVSASPDNAFMDRDIENRLNSIKGKIISVVGARLDLYNSLRLEVIYEPDPDKNY